MSPEYGIKRSTCTFQTVTTRLHMHLRSNDDQDTLALPHSDTYTVTRWPCTWIGNGIFVAKWLANGNC
eukprot:14619433-Alexandrium_andersonii.AAC.1